MLVVFARDFKAFLAKLDIQPYRDCTKIGIVLHTLSH